MFQLDRIQIDFWHFLDQRAEIIVNMNYSRHRLLCDTDANFTPSCTNLNVHSACFHLFNLLLTQYIYQQVFLSIYC